MRICRVAIDDGLFFGLIEGLDEQGRVTDGTLIALIEGHPFGELVPEGRLVRPEDVRFVAPVLPSKVVAVGRNYVDHAKELGNEVPTSPMIFLKPSTAVIGPGEPIVLPWQSERVDHEAELAVVIGRMCRDVPIERVGDVILGYTCANDVTARDLQKVDAQWGRAKGFDTFCPLGPWITTDLDPEDAQLTGSVNGAVRQAASTSDMVFGVPELISWITSVMTLLPGDVILTGTPAGIGPLSAGDEVSVTVTGIGTLTNPVVDHG